MTQEGALGPRASFGRQENHQGSYPAECRIVIWWRDRSTSEGLAGDFGAHRELSQPTRGAAATLASTDELGANGSARGYVIDMVFRTRRGRLANAGAWATRRVRTLALAALVGAAASAAESCSDDNSREKNSFGIGTGDPSAVPSDGGGVLEQAAAPGTAMDAALCDNGGCPDGYLCCAPCCLAGLAPVCLQAVGGRCPLPDLSVNEAALATKMSLDLIEAGPCELEEKCVSGTGTRKVLRFDARTPNTGPVDLVLGNPDAGGPFEWAACHKHYHFTNFAQYTLLDDAGAALVVGRKQAFCARDSARVDKTAAFTAKYDCENQGIQRGWEDIYDPTLPCQYLDITDVPAGTYWLEMVVNPGRSITELDYDNNSARVKVVLP